jgi:peptide/nickel transport system permease protein
MEVRVVAEEVPRAAAGSPATGAISNLSRTLISNRKALIGLILLGVFVAMALFHRWIAPYDPSATTFGKMKGPSPAHLLGTTSYGQDVFSQVVYGTAQPLLIAIVAGLAATVVSVLVGVSSAYLGGLSDHILSLITDIFLVLPALPLMIVIAAYARGGGMVVLIAVIVVTGWSFGARQLRSQALSLRNREFLEAARVRGERASYIILFEILPTMISLIVANFLAAALYAVLAAAGLQFLGLGDVNDPSWGSMLYWSQNNEALMSGAPLWAVAPGVCIALLGAAFALLNYAFDEVSNPALRPVKKRHVRPI